jgi:Rrf2 family protein
MFRLTKKGDYAVFLMCHLAQRGPLGTADVVSAHDLAEHSGLNKSVVANLLKDLTRAGLLESVRGLRGGYRLARPAEDVSLGNILEVVEGPFLLVDCAHDEATDAQPGDEHYCSLESVCPSRSPMRVLHERIARLMNELKLPELLGSAAPASAGSSLTFDDPTNTR